MEAPLRHGAPSLAQGRAPRNSRLPRCAPGTGIAGIARRCRPRHRTACRRAIESGLCDARILRRWFSCKVRLLVYNIRYATGTGPAFHLPVPGAGYLRSNRRILTGITEFLRSERPDIIGLIEVDTGSIRTGMLNQAEHVARELGHYSTYECKYGTSSINQFVPIVRKQANAFLSAPHVSGARFHYFDTGIKRLIIELELADLCVFLVHLSLKFRQRQSQLRYLHDLIMRS